jgi:succinyl-CoA synthetase alpha subunit
VQFGHAGASANAERETAVAKNQALAAAGAHVPKSFDDFGLKINQVWPSCLEKNVFNTRIQ